MAETIALNYWLAGEEKKKFYFLDLQRAGGRPQRPWVATGLSRIAAWAASPPPASSPYISISTSRFRSLSLRPNQCDDGWAGEREYVCEERAAKIVDGETEEKCSYLVESGQTEIRPLLIFASPRRFVSSLIQCLDRVKGIEARGRAGGEQGNSAPTQTTV
ncbi:hypothetical protein TIFTF001_028071 [Ficus carica]|uniref:Uncharacterized protein n=1 Tax=Ficus carica TaxID=3494 RepID=A0AA88IW01_FICCA|nr:hypothetical protein TIFTF001_028071 [Ficus carica]